MPEFPFKQRLDPDRKPGRLPIPSGEQGGWGKVLLVTRYQPQCASYFCESWAGLIEYGLREGDRRDFAFSKTMHWAANDMARALLKTDCDSICFIDSDAVFGSDALEELRSDPDGWGYDVLQAFTVKRGWPPEPMFLVEMPDQPRLGKARRGTHFTTQLPMDKDYIYPGQGESYRIACSLHFTLIRRALFERMLEADGPEFTYWFEYLQDMGEDINFAKKAHAIGAKFGMSTRLKVGHWSEMTTGWDTMVDYYHRKMEVETGAAPASLDGYAAFHQGIAALSDLVAGYTGETRQAVYEKVIGGPGLVIADKWERTKPQTPEAVKFFYGQTPEYLYDLVRWNASPHYQKLLKQFEGVSGEKVLEIGGGLGTLAEYLAVNGNEVHYHDLPGNLRDFAEWRFNRLNGYRQNIVMFGAVYPGFAENLYDRVVAVDVLEHVHPEEFEGLCEALVMALKPGGMLFAHNTWDKHGGMYPFHFDHSGKWEEFVKRSGLKPAGEFAWKKPDAG